MGYETEDPLEEGLYLSIEEEMENKAWEPYPPCTRSDCHAWRADVCTALVNNDFGSRPCPFYKNRAVNRMEQENCMQRLIQTDRTDLMKKYKKTFTELGLFDTPDSFADGVADELEQYTAVVMRELLSDDAPEQRGIAGGADGAGEGDCGEDGDDDWDD